MERMTVARVARFTAALRWEDLDDAVQRRAELTLRDTAGALAAGRETRAARIAARVADPAGADDGRLDPVRSGPTMAALALGVAASVLDIEDGHYRGGGIHPSSPVLAAALAAAPPHAGAADLMAALVAGAEVAIRAAWLLWPDDQSDQDHCTGTAGALGAAAAAARVRGLDAAVVRRALDVAWAHAPMSAFRLPMVKESIGWSAATGTAAALLAEAGFNAEDGDAEREPIAFGRHPFDGARADDPFVASIGERFESCATYFKRHSACRYTHAAADALGELLEAERVTAGQIAAIEVRCLPNARFLADPRPTSRERAQYSFPFVLASVALRGAAGPAQIAEAALDDPEVLELAARVSVVPDAALSDAYPDSYPGHVLVRTADGRELRRDRRGAVGDPGEPLSADQLARKFHALADPVLGPERADELERMCLDPRGWSAGDLLAALDVVCPTAAGVAAP